MRGHANRYVYLSAYAHMFLYVHVSADVHICQHICAYTNIGKHMSCIYMHMCASVGMVFHVDSLVVYNIYLKDLLCLTAGICQIC